MAVRRTKGKRRKSFVHEWYDRLPDGSLKQRTKFFATKREADDHAEHLRTQTAAGRPSLDPGSTVAEVATSLLKLMTMRRGNTARSYKSMIDTHIVSTFGQWRMRDLGRGALLNFLLDLRAAPVVRGNKTLRPQHAKSTVRGLLATFSRLGSHAVTCGIYSANPFLGLGKELGLAVKPEARTNAVRKKAMSKAQLTRFISAVSIAAPRLHVLFLLLARTGLRINEALALRVSDVDLNAGTLRVEREKVKDHAGRWTIGRPKSERSERTVHLSAQLMGALRRWIDVERAADKLQHGWRATPRWLFYVDRDPATYDPSDAACGTLDDSNIRRVMRAVLYVLAAEEPEKDVPPADRFPQHFTPHALRHAFATLLLSQGKPLQYVRDQLGHESIKLTADTYGAGFVAVERATDCLDDADWSVGRYGGDVNGNAG